MDFCRDRINIILHGHEHFPIAFRDDRSGCLVVSAGTATAFQRDGLNSLHTLVFSETEVRVSQFDWRRSRFRKVKEWRYDILRKEFGLKWEEPRAVVLL